MFYASTSGSHSAASEVYVAASGNHSSASKANASVSEPDVAASENHPDNFLEKLILPTEF